MTNLTQFHTLIPVLGCQRSGTTLTALIIGAHERVLMIDEDEGGYPLLQQYLADSNARSSVLRQASCKASAKYRDPGQRLPNGQLRPRVSRLAIKAPNATHLVPELIDLASSARFVVPIRDVRDVVASILGVQGPEFANNQRRLFAACPEIERRFPVEMNMLADPRLGVHAKIALIWKIKNLLCRQLQSAGMACHMVRYERLVEHPRREIRRLLSFLGLPDSRRCRQHQLVYRGQAVGRTSRTRRVDGQSVGRWRTVLSAADEAEIWKVAGPTMRKFGFDRSTGSGPD